MFVSAGELEFVDTMRITTFTPTEVLGVFYSQSYASHLSSDNRLFSTKLDWHFVDKTRLRRRAVRTLDLQSSPGLIVSVRLAPLTPTSQQWKGSLARYFHIWERTMYNMNNGKNRKLSTVSLPGIYNILIRRPQHPRWASAAWKAWLRSTIIGLRICFQGPASPELTIKPGLDCKHPCSSPSGR